MATIAGLRELYSLAPLGITLGLDRITAASDRLGAPHRRITAVQIAGTNGKGTVSSVLARTAQLAGLNVGLYTSPHLHRFAERIRVNGAEITPDDLSPCLVAALSVTRGNNGIALTFFEVATLAALLYFAQRELDLVVLEAGLGGRLDATSIVPPIATVITSIGMDHGHILGHTEELIAAEKAAIARNGVPMFSGPLTPSVLNVVASICESSHAPLYILGRDFRTDESLRPPWPGDHHRRNASVAREVCRSLRQRFPTMTDAVFAEALETTSVAGRFEYLPGPRQILIDGAHNMPAVIALTEALAEKQLRVDTLIFGALKDKPYEEMLALLRPLARRTILVNAPIERTFNAAEVARRLRAESAADMRAALDMIQSEDSSPGVVLITGSFFTVAAARQILLGEPFDPPVGL